MEQFLVEPLNFNRGVGENWPTVIVGTLRFMGNVACIYGLYSSDPHTTVL